MVLMGRMVVSTNATVLDTRSIKDMAEYRVTATSLGTSAIEAASALSFDQASVDTFITLARIGELTASGSLGHEVGELAPTSFNDVDDYNNYSKIDTIANSAIFKTHMFVTYVTISGNVITQTSSKTFNKQITVYVTSDYLVNYTTTPPKKDTLTFSTVFSYWYFR